MIEQGDSLIAYEADGTTHGVVLGSRLGKPGGEGAAYETNLDGQVAKIFSLGTNNDKSRATENKYLKIRNLIESGISYPGICFPRMMLTTTAGEFVGYTMDRAKGDPLGEVINPMVIRDEFPNMKREDLVQICIDILEKIVFLHNNGIVLCDINLGNILVDGIKQGQPIAYFIDTDSYQLNDLLGEVGVDIFTPPELHGRDLGKTKRTLENEYFSVSTLLFMIMLPGQKPYARIGGTGSVAENIRTGIFPYAKGGEYSGEYAPNIIYRHIWSHLAYKNYFWETFHKEGTKYAPENRISAREWLKHFKHYRQLLTDGTIAGEDPEGLKVFPSDYKREAGTEFAEVKPKRQTKLCPICHAREIPSYYEFCDDCKGKTAEQRTCEYCGSSFPITYGQLKHSRDTGEQLPSQCYSCRNSKPCPICHKTRIPKNYSYCDNCKETTAEYRECVNCHKKFPISYGLRDWEKRKGYTRKQCDICKAAHCTADPCCHSDVYQQRQREAERKAAAAAPQKPTSSTKSEGCYIATCVYGSYSHPNTMVLRTYRDNVLQRTRRGRAFIRAYYAMSPKLVNLLGNCMPITKAWRYILDGIVKRISDRYGF